MKVTNQAGPVISFLEASWSHGPVPRCKAGSGSAILRGLPYPIGGRISRAATFYPEFAVARACPDVQRTLGEHDPPKRMIELSELLHQCLSRFG